jgi:hypothetical protein
VTGRDAIEFALLQKVRELFRQCRRSVLGDGGGRNGGDQEHRTDENKENPARQLILHTCPFM